ncbi:Rieske (2Fe-2S) protein [Deminuibacter soli]|uniref:(2Fe-2S)-binding protein n=1 Tax=Deminuibacter soli TaxID=2291815 RepID=A0A3E1NPZ7_9BACT|nr:Rieske 2Fe-2S domain-containing protein [Deminuibacter soli]RFM29977.1 (2Fe-2S)-binding protein [Deminuibacter soli]
MSKKINWHKLADSRAAIAWQSNDMAIVEAGGKTMTLVQHGETLYAVAYKCPHAGGIMADGFIDATGNVVCPLHRYKFSLKNGRNVSGEGYYLKTFAVEEREDGVYIGFEASGLFGWI